VRADATIELFGHHLAGTQHVVRFRHVTLGTELEARGVALTVGPPDLTATELAANESLRLADTRVEVRLAQATPDAWAAGQWSVWIELIPAEEDGVRSTNAAVVPIAPSFAVAGADSPQVTVTAPDGVQVDLTLMPPLRPRQRASLLLGNRELPGPDVAAPTTRPSFIGRMPEAMTAHGVQHLARLRVDGVESLFIIRDATPETPVFDPTQRITMP